MGHPADAVVEAVVAVLGAGGEDGGEEKRGDE
jgi:hypothetical protein